MTLCGTFRKAVARIECATHHEKLNNTLIWLKKIHFTKNLAKNSRVSKANSPEPFPEAIDWRLSVKDMFFKILQNLQEITCWSLF